MADRPSFTCHAPLIIPADGQPDRKSKPKFTASHAVPFKPNIAPDIAPAEKIAQVEKLGTQPVIPANAGIHFASGTMSAHGRDFSIKAKLKQARWIPACAGMTKILEMTK